MTETSLTVDRSRVADRHGVSLGEAFRVWLRVAALSFGGPAGQIAVMHRIIVDEKKWVGEARFLHALSYCMLLPGPEAHQLAIYIGWLMHRWPGAIIAGGLFVLHAKSLPGNPYDGHTLRDVIEDTQKLTGCEIERAYVDKGYRGHDAQNPGRVFISGQKRGVFGVIKRELRRRSAIEPVIGHMKAEGHLGRCYLKGRAGDAANTILTAVGYNFRRILAWLRDLLRKILSAILRAFMTRSELNPAC